MPVTVPTPRGEMMSGNRVIAYRGIGNGNHAEQIASAVATSPHAPPQLKEKRMTACAGRHGPFRNLSQALLIRAVSGRLTPIRSHEELTPNGLPSLIWRLYKLTYRARGQCARSSPGVGTPLTSISKF